MELPLLGIQLVPLAVESRNINHWTTREIQQRPFFFFFNGDEHSLGVVNFEVGLFRGMQNLKRKGVSDFSISPSFQPNQF